MSLDLTATSSLPNGHTSSVRSKLDPSVSNHLSHKRQNGAVVATRTGKMERVAVNTVSERDGGMVAVNGKEKELGCYRKCNGSPTIQLVFNDKKTKLIVKLLFSKLCPSYEKNCVVVERELSRLHSSADKELIYRLSKCMVDLLVERNIISINLEDFTKQRWNVHAGNMYTEFSRVAYETFSDATNWGRIFVFLGFSVSFSIYLINRQVPNAASSVLEWCCQVVEEDLAKFFTANGGWEGLADYLDTALRATRRNRSHSSSHHHGNRSRQQQQQMSPHLRSGGGLTQHPDVANGDDSNGSLWPSAIAAGAVAVGAMAALTLRQAFS